jgi:hypothetical protein
LAACLVHPTSLSRSTTGGSTWEVNIERTGQFVHLSLELSASNMCHEIVLFFCVLSV